MSDMNTTKRSETKSAVVNLRVTDAERDELHAWAARVAKESGYGLSLAEVARRTLLDAARARR